jgi:hypothetical protein
MSSNGKRNRGHHPYMNGKDALPQAGDEQGAYSREQLLRMNDRFVTAVARAIAAGKESAAIVGAAPTRRR